MRGAVVLFLVLVCMALMAQPARADTVTIGLSTGGFITTVASGTGLTHFDGAFGGFSTVVVSGNGESVLTPPDLLFSDTISTAGASGGELHIFVTDSGLTSPVGNLPFTSSFTSNTLPAGWTLTTATFISSSDALFTGTPLSAETFTAIGTNTQIATGATGGGPYSITQEYVIHATGAGDTNDTIDMGAAAVATPEPSPLVALGCGLTGIGFLLRRRVQSFQRHSN